MLITAYIPSHNSKNRTDSCMFFQHFANRIYLTSDYDAVYIAGDLNGKIVTRLGFIDQLDDVATRNAMD